MVHGVGVAMVLRVVPPRVNSQAILTSQNVRGRHLVELSQLETLPELMQVAFVVYRSPRFAIAILPSTGHRLA